MVRWTDHPTQPGTDPEVVLGHCRHRAWEQTRAAASARAAVQVVERRVEIPVPLQQTRRDWPALLGELSRQLDNGRLYDRDLAGLGRALEPVLQAYRWRARLTGAPDLS